MRTKIRISVCGEHTELHDWQYDPDTEAKRTISEHTVDQHVSLEKKYRVGNGSEDPHVTAILETGISVLSVTTTRTRKYEDDAVPNHWGTAQLVCENNSGTDSFIRTSYEGSVTEKAFGSIKGYWNKVSDRECKVRKDVPHLSGTEKMDKTDTYTFHTHFGQLGEPVSLEHDSQGGQFVIGPQVREIDTLSSPRALAQIFLYQFSVREVKGNSYEERRTYAHAQAALTKPGEDGREADPTAYKRIPRLEEMIKDTVEEFYEANFQSSDSHHENYLEENKTYDKLKIIIEFLC